MDKISIVLLFSSSVSETLLLLSNFFAFIGSSWPGKWVVGEKLWISLLRKEGNFCISFSATRSIKLPLYINKLKYIFLHLFYILYKTEISIGILTMIRSINVY